MSWFKKSLNKKKMIKTLLGISSIALIGSSAILLTSCSSNNDGLTTDDLVSTGSGEYYTTNYNNGLDLKLTPKDVFEEALKTRTPIEKIYRNKLGQQCLAIINKIIELDNIERYKYDLAEEKKKIDADYTKLVNDLKSSNPNDWQIVLQKDTLDQNGGTEEVYKENQLNEWAITYLTSKIFEKSYLKVFDGTNYLSNPTKQQILDASNNTNGSGTSFQFWADYNGAEETKFIENFFASVQSYVFNLWMKINQPFVVNMSLWKYGNPKQGIDKFYNIPSSDDSSSESSDDSSDGASTYSENSDNSDSSSSDDSSSSVSSNYNFPYFQNGTYDATNDTFTTVDKFINFVNASNQNENFKTTGSNIGLIDIPQEFTEDSSTYILAKRSTIFNDLYPEFAAASMALFTNQSPTVSKNVSATKNSATEFDTITSNFVTNINPSNNYWTTISSDAVNNIINESGNYKSYRGSNLYSVDAFKIQNSSLNEFMLLRDSAGVHAIAIDGGSSFVSESDFNQKISKMKMPILYRSMMSLCQYETLDNPVFTLDLNSELKSFFDENLNMIMLSLVNDTIDNFSNQNTNDFTNKENNKESLKRYIVENKFNSDNSNQNDLFNEWQEINFISNSIKNRDTVQEKFISTKESLNVNYGTLLPNNGLASRWIYSQDSNGIFEITKKYDDVFGQTINDDTLNNFINSFNTSTIKNYISNLDSAGAFSKKIIKYSQQIWTNNNDVNAVNYDYTKNNTSTQTYLVNMVLVNSSKSLATVDISNTSNIIQLNSSDNLSSVSSLLSNIQSNLVQEIANKKLFELSNDKKFDKYNELMGSNTFNINNLNEYAKKLLLEETKNNNENELSLMKSLYTSVLTLNYILKNDGQNFLDYVKTKINFGDDAYIVWTDTFNSKYDNLNNSTTIDTLDANGSRMISNIDNSLNGMYSSQNSNNLEVSSHTGTSNNSLYGVSDSHFNIKEAKFGYVGLQNESSNTLSSTTAAKLFTKNREANSSGTTATGNQIYQGLLYKYGSRESLVNKIKEMTNWSQIEKLISEIQKEIPIFDMDQVSNTKDPDEIKKVFLGDNLDGSSGIISEIPAEAFQKYEGVLTVNPYYESSGTSTIKNATYVKQLNYEDLNVDTLDNLKNNIGDTLFYDLLISAALDSNNQTLAINEISKNNKFTIYDINIKNALGEKWVENWLLPSEK